MQQSEKKSIDIKPYMPNELARFYQVSHPTFNKWVKGISESLVNEMDSTSQLNKWKSFLRSSDYQRQFFIENKNKQFKSS